MSRYSTASFITDEAALIMGAMSERFEGMIIELLVCENKAENKGVASSFLTQPFCFHSRGFELSNSDRFRYRTRYFTNSGIIGSKKFVSANYQRV